MPDPRFATEYAEDEDTLDREPVDQADDDEAEGEDYLSLAIKTARIVLAGLEARQAGDDDEAARRLRQYDRLWPKLAGAVEDAEAAVESEHG